MVKEFVLFSILLNSWRREREFTCLFCRNLDAFRVFSIDAWLRALLQELSMSEVLHIVSYCIMKMIVVEKVIPVVESRRKPNPGWRPLVVIK